MLVLSRYEGERIRLVVGNTIIWLTVVEIGRRDRKVRLGIKAPLDVVVMREEVLDEDRREQQP